VRRSAWPNVPRNELVRLVDEWAAREGVEARVIFESSETADDTIARDAACASERRLALSGCSAAGRSSAPYAASSKRSRSA
jgi:hypothetical protein